MNSLRSIFPHARVGLIALCLVLSVCLGLVLVSRYVLGWGHAELARAQNDFSAVQLSLREKQADLNLLQTHIERFRHLAQRGLLDTPDRAAWVEQLLQSHRRSGLPSSLSYTLHPANPASRPSPSALSKMAELAPDKSPGKLQFHELEFKLQDVHEEELLTFLEDFESHPSGPFRVDSCQLSERTPQGLTVQCSLRFFSLPWIGVTAKTDSPATVTTPNRPAPQASHLDTLVYSPTERDALVRARRDDTTQTPGARLRLSGIVKRERGRSTVWINQHTVTEGQSLPPAHSTIISATDVTLDGRRVRVGETLDLGSLERATDISSQAEMRKDHK